MRLSLPRRGLFLPRALISLNCLLSIAPLLGQPILLQLGSGSGVLGGSVELNLSYQANGGTAAAGLQWTLNYSTTAFSGITVTEGAAATTAGKNVSCSASNGSHNCVAVGFNNNTIPDGVVAIVNLNIAAQAGVTSSPIGLDNPVAASPGGDALAINAVGGAVSIQPPAGASISQFSCDPDYLRPPGITQCTVTLTAAATGSPVPVLLSTDNPHVGIPGTVAVPPGSESVTFGVSGVSVVSQETGLLTATLGGSSQTTLLTILPTVALSQLSCNPLFLQPPGITNCTVTLTALADTAGARVFLSTNNSNIVIPSTVTVPAGANSITFGVSGATVPTEQQADITATFQQVTQAVVLSILPQPTLSSLVCAPSALAAGESSACTVGLTVIAATGGKLISISSSSASVTTPASVTVPAGQQSHTFTATAVNGATGGPVTITATSGSASLQEVLTVTAPVPPLTLSLSSTSGMPGGTVSLELSLDTMGGPPPAGLQWTLSYAAADLVNVTATEGPAADASQKTVVCEAGNGTLTCLTFGLNSLTMPDGVVAVVDFEISSIASSTSPVGLANTVAVSPSGDELPATASGGVLTVLPPAPNPDLSELSCDPSAFQPPGTTDCAVTLTLPAGVGGVPVLLSTDNPNLGIPGSVTVPEGSTSASFAVSGAVVASQQVANLSATLGAVSLSAPLTILPAPSVVSEWRFEEVEEGGGVAIVDSSGSGYDGVTFGPGNVPYSGVQGSARVFNGISDYVQIPGGTGLRSTSFTIRTWVKVQSYPTSLGVLLSSYDGNYRGWYLAVIPSGQVVFMAAHPPNVSRWLVSGATLTRHDWHSVALTFDDATGTAVLYFDGLADSGFTFTGLESNATANPTLAGASWYGGYRFKGALDETQVVAGVLSPSEILSDHLAFLPPPPPADPITVTNWKFEDGGSDSSGNQNDATLVGTQLIEGMMGDARRFNGLGDHLQASVPDFFYPSGFTFRTWVKLHSYPTSSSFGVVASTSSDNSRGWYLGVNWDGHVLLNVAGLPQSSATLFSNGVLSLDQWYHLTATYDSSTGIGGIFVDGAAAGQRFFSGFTPHDDVPFTAGRASWSDSNYLHFDGDEMTAYSEPKTSEKILDDYQSFAIPPPGALVPTGEWHFDETGGGAGITLLDSTGNGLHAVTQGTGTQDLAGVDGLARQFSGPGNYAAIPPSSEFGVESFSFSTWVRLDSYPTATGWGVIVSNYGGDFRGWFAGVTASGQVILSVSGLPASAAWLVSSDSLVLNNWYHLAVTLDGESRQGAIYVNGALVRTAVFPAYTPQTGIAPTFARASWYWGAFLRCSLDEGRFYSSELTAAEVMSEYNSIP